MQSLHQTAMAAMRNGTSVCRENAIAPEPERRASGRSDHGLEGARATRPGPRRALPLDADRLVQQTRWTRKPP